jgi:hypothetical protein
MEDLISLCFSNSCNIRRRFRILDKFFSTVEKFRRDRKSGLSMATTSPAEKPRMDECEAVTLQYNGRLAILMALQLEVV